MHVSPIRLMGISLLLLFLMKSSESSATFLLVVFVTHFSPYPLILLSCLDAILPGDITNLKDFTKFPWK